MHIYPCRLTPSPPLIYHRSMQHHYTVEGSHIEECTYTKGQHIPPHPIEHRSLKTTAILNKFHI